MGVNRPEGYEFKAANGYWYRKVNGKWKLMHHIVAEQTLGRSIDTACERVVFKDKNPGNLSPDNIEVREKTGGKQKRLAMLRARIERDQEELRELRGEA